MGYGLKRCAAATSARHQRYRALRVARCSLHCEPCPRGVDAHEAPAAAEECQRSASPLLFPSDTFAQTTARSCSPTFPPTLSPNLPDDMHLSPTSTLPPLLSRLYSPCLAHVSPRGLASASSCTSPVLCPHGPSSSGLSEHPQAQTHGEPRQAHRVCIVYASCMHCMLATRMLPAASALTRPLFEPRGGQVSG